MYILLNSFKIVTRKKETYVYVEHGHMYIPTINVYALKYIGCSISNGQHLFNNMYL